MIPAKFGAYETNRCEVIQILVNFVFFCRRPSWILKNGGFGTSGVWSVLRRSSVPNLEKIGLTVQELFKFL